MKTSRSLALALALALNGSATHGQTSAKNFDVTQAVTLSGTVAGVTLFRDRSYLIIDVKNDATDAVQRWAVEGNERNTLIDAGWQLGRLPGPTARTALTPTVLPYRDQVVKVVAYQPRLGVGVQTILGDSPAIIGGTPTGLAPDSPFANLARGNLYVDLRELFDLGRFVHGTQVTFSDGSTLLFGSPVN